MSSEILLDEIKSISEIFSMKAQHKSEIEELLAYQDNHNLELSE